MIESGSAIPESPKNLAWYIGTIGFGYSDWKSVFYPADLESRNYLNYYSRYFNCVEIDSTFYGPPKKETIVRWANSTPPDFLFCLKAPRHFTHDTGLVGVKNEVFQFINVCQNLGEKLGVLLFQFPPSFQQDKLPLLESLLSSLPKGVRYAIEIRHRSWYSTKNQNTEPTLATVLRQLGICWASTEFPGLPAQIFPTVDFLYIRWIGQHGSYVRHNFEREDKSAKLIEWYQHILSRTNEDNQIFGFFNNDYAGFAAGTAHRFKQISGLTFGSLTPPVQQKLF